MRSSKNSDRFTIVNELARRRGFYWQSCEIYGGVGGFVTYGPLGVKLKRNIESLLRDQFVKKLGVQEIESPVIAPAEVFEASGHVNHFKEPMIECLKCNKRFRADHLLRELVGISEADAEKMDLATLKETILEHNVKCPDCGGDLGEPKQFLTMFKTTIGPYSEAVGYGRPEAAQGIFVEFKRLVEQAREKLPFGAIQIGRALRNEISPRQGLIRLREFTIADLEFFFDPAKPNCHLLEEVKNETLRFLLTATRQKNSEETVEVTVKEALAKGIVKSEWQIVFMALAKKLLIELGVPAEKQRFIEKFPWERAHYSLQSFDQEVLVDRWGWIEVSGHAYRADYDLKSHMQHSKADLTIYKEYETPVETEQITVKPIMAKLGPVFKNETSKVAEALVKTDGEQLETALKREGKCLLEGYKILPEYVTISHQKQVERGKHFIPHVVEPSFGIDRLFYVTLEYAYNIKKDRTILSFPRKIAPVQVGVYPLVNKDNLPNKAFEIYTLLVNEGFMAEYDDAGAIGRRYARADEAGLQLGITIDYKTLEDNTVTIRDRDTWKQVRTSVQDLTSRLHDYFKTKIDFEQLGTPL